MKCYLIYNDSVVHQFDAGDVTDARAQAAAFVKSKLINVILATAQRRISVIPVAPPPPTVDDQPA